MELYLRQSRDGSALLVTPTMLTYRETLERKTSSAKRDLYITLTFTDAAGSNPTTVTIPLGSFAPSSTTHFLDPIQGPYDDRMMSPLGAANSIWIANPFRKPAGTPTESAPDPAAAAAAAAAAAKKPPVVVQKPAAVAQPVPNNGGGNGFGKTVVPAPLPQDAALQQDGAGGVKTPVKFSAGDPIAPVSISVAIIETKPGSAFARAVSSLLKGSKQGIVDASDPSKRAATIAAENTASDAITTAWITARQNYATNLQTYCTASTADRPGKAPALYAAQMTLTMTAKRAAQTLPFTTIVDPDSGANGDGLCPH